MEKEVRRDIIWILGQVIKILDCQESKDILELKDLSNHTIHDASIYQDIDSMQIAVATYAIYKLFDRGIAISDDYYEKIIQEFREALNVLELNRFGEYNEHIETIFFLIKKIDQSALVYIEEVLDKARITKGSKLFDHGLSAKRAAEIMGITEWELLNYLGKTEIVDRHQTGGMSAKRRVQQALELFEIV